MASQKIRGLIAVPPRETLHKYQNTHTQLLTLLLRCAPEGLALFARLLDITTQNEDFEVLSDRKKLVHHQSFFKCLTEVLQVTCTTFTFASDHSAEIQRVTLQLRGAVENLVDNAEDEDLRTETIKTIIDAATIGLSLARQIGDKFQHVRLMLEEMNAHFTAVKGAKVGDNTSPVLVKLTQTTKKFEFLESGWAEIVTLLVTASANIKVDLGEISSAKAGADKVTLNIAKNVVLTTTSATLILTIVSGYYEMSKKYLDESVAELGKIEADAKNKDEFNRLETKFRETHKGIEELINTTRDSWNETPTKIVKKLSQGQETTEEERIKFEKLLALYESTDRMVTEHGKLEALLHSSPEGVKLLGELCLVSTRHKDFQLYKPLIPYKHIKSEWFRAGLHQVVNRGSDSFTTANKELNVIEAHAKEIQTLVVDIVELITQGEPEDIKAMLPDKLKCATEKGNECRKKSAEVEKKFDAVIHLVNELSEALTSTRSENEKKASESKAPNTPANEHQAVVKALQEGLFVLIGVRKQWDLLTRFFYTLANNMIRIQIDEILAHFGATAEVAGKKRKPNKKLTRYARETLQGMASDITKVAFQVNMICSTYLQISKTHLLDPLSKVDGLLALTDADQIKGATDSISIICDKSQKAIKERSAESRVKLLTEYNKKMEEIASVFEEEDCEEDCDEDEEDYEEECEEEKGGDNEGSKSELSGMQEPSETHEK